jgi:hypothetical protein
MRAQRIPGTRSGGPGSEDKPACEPPSLALHWLGLEVSLARVERARRLVSLRIAYCGPAGAGKTRSFDLARGIAARRVRRVLGLLSN